MIFNSDEKYSLLLSGSQIKVFEIRCLLTAITLSRLFYTKSNKLNICRDTFILDK